MTFHVPEQFRVKTGQFATRPEHGCNGLFFIPSASRRPDKLRAIVSDGEGWEHVSVSLPNRCPTWDEMCQVKGLFWGDDDCVMQLHPPKADWISNHPYCLHLWRPVGVEIPRPPGMMVGIQELGTLK